jgi:hypothetical protein
VPLGAQIVPPGHDKKFSDTLSREAGERDMAMIRAMNPPTIRKELTRPPIREPELPPDFASRAAKLDKEIVERGIGVDRSKLLALGKERFTKLLALDCEARGEQRIFGPRIDFSRWPGVEFAFARIGAAQASIPERRHSEVLSGAGIDREAVRGIAGFDDLWKTTAEPRAVRAVYAFRDVFEPLLFSRSLLNRIGDDNRLHSNFFCGGNPRKVPLFRDWLKTLPAPLLSVSVREPLWHLVAWLSGERAPAPSQSDLAREFFGVRSPDANQLRFCDALMQGFALGLDSWNLWQYCGRLTRKAWDIDELTRWRQTLAKRFPRIANFHNEILAFFYRDVGTREGAHRQLDDKAHRLFIDEIVHDRLQQISFLVALAVEDALPGSLVARFQSWFLIEGAKQPKTLGEKITEALRTAFPGARFTVTIAEDVT